MSVKYDLEERTFQFANECRILVKSLKYTTANVEDGKQLIKSSGSVGANYIKANPGIMEFKKLINESEEITKILSTIIKKFE